MLKWEIKNGDDKLREDINYTKTSFDEWFSIYWQRECTREKMLSEESPVYHLYYKMTKTFEEIKKEYPYDALQQCSSCEEYVDKWIETKFSFCNEYNCGMSLCKKCADELSNLTNKI